MEFDQAWILTEGSGVAGVWAASIAGGGGVLQSDIMDTDEIFGGTSPGEGTNGDAGDIDIALKLTAIDTASGPSIIAHSIAGAGFSTSDGGDQTPGGQESTVTATSSCGSGSSAAVTVTDSNVQVSGDASAIIVGTDARNPADIAPGVANPIKVTVAPDELPQAIVSNESVDHVTVSYINNSGRQVLLDDAGTVENTAANGYAAASPFGSLWIGVPVDPK